MNPKWIEGKTIKSVDMNPFPDGRGGTAHGPVITFEDGSRISFYTEETDTGEYGTSIVYTPAKSPRRRED